MPITIPYDPSRMALYSPEHRETFFERGASYTIPQLTVEAARLAYYRAEESAAEQARLAEALGRVGFTDLELFGNAERGAAAFAAIGSYGTPLLSFRGTQPDNFKAVLTDLRIRPVVWPESAGNVHEGFALAMQAMRPQILKWIERVNPDLSKLILTGHSLGAAMATLAATIWRPEWLITFGSPRVGDTAFVGTVVTKNIVRFVDCCDAVTEEPPEFLGFRHVGNPTYITRAGLLVDNPDLSFIQADRRQARIAYAVRYAWQFWRNALARDMADHAPVNYARGLFVVM